MSNAKASAAALWTIAHSALYGFHITSLNGVQAAVVCSDRSALFKRIGLRECLDLSVCVPERDQLIIRTRHLGLQ
jgi:hypothetical protein